MTKLRTIDVIALEKQRDVLLIVFPELHLREWLSQTCIDVYQPRNDMVTWLKAHGIMYEPCLGATRLDESNPPMGNLYIDVPWVEGHDTYELVRQHLECPDGSPRDRHVRFCYYKFASAKLLQKLQSTNKTGNNVDEKV